MQGLIEMIHSYTVYRKDERGKTKRGKFMNYFTNVCSTLESHEVMLEVLPGGNEYVSLFTGVLKTLITVSMLSSKSRNDSLIEH